MSLLEKLLVSVVAAGAMFVTGFLYGNHVRGQADTAKLAEAQAQAQVEYQAAVKDGNERAAKLLLENEAQAKLYAQLQKEKSLEKFVFIHDSPEPIAAVTVSIEYVGVWNAALAGQPAPVATGGAAGAPQPSGITPVDLLENHITNAERCERITRQLNSLIDWELRGASQ